MSLNLKIDNRSLPVKFLKSNENIEKEDKLTQSIDEDKHFGAVISKIDQITQGQKPYVRRILSNIFYKTPRNAKSICDFIIAERNEINIKESTAEWHIKVLGQTQKFLGFKDFNAITKNDTLNYLDSLRKLSINDPTNRSIGIETINKEFY